MKHADRAEALAQALAQTLLSATYQRHWCGGNSWKLAAALTCEHTCHHVQACRTLADYRASRVARKGGDDESGQDLDGYLDLHAESHYRLDARHWKGCYKRPCECLPDDAGCDPE